MLMCLHTLRRTLHLSSKTSCSHINICAGCASRQPHSFALVQKVEVVVVLFSRAPVTVYPFAEIVASIASVVSVTRLRVRKPAVGFTTEFALSIIFGVTSKSDVRRTRFPNESHVTVDREAAVPFPVDSIRRIACI